MEKHLAIYYIATSNYKEGFIHFKNNLPYLYPEMKKTVVILSDGLTEWDNIIEGNITYKVYHIEHFCWPIVALFKMKHILDHKIDCDYAMYMNGDLQYNINYDTSLNKIDLNKLNVSRHHHSNINKCFDNNIFEKIDKSSLAYIGKPYTYIQSGLFIGPSDIVFKMCKEVCDMVEIDLKSNIIPQWHDESYLNKWCIEHTSLVKKDQKLMSYSKFISDIPFAVIHTINKDKWI
jgi:hypothetical protein